MLFDNKRADPSGCRLEPAKYKTNKIIQFCCMNAGKQLLVKSCSECRKGKVSGYEPLKFGVKSSSWTSLPNLAVWRKGVHKSFDSNSLIEKGAGSGWQIRHWNLLFTSREEQLNWCSTPTRNQKQMIRRLWSGRIKVLNYSPPPLSAATANEGFLGRFLQ
jgi:hypothetical protein